MEFARLLFLLGMLLTATAASATADTFLMLLHYSPTFSGRFSLDCPRLGSQQFACTGHLLEVWKSDGDERMCVVSFVARDLQFTKTGPNTWTRFFEGSFDADEYTLVRSGSSWKLTTRAVLLREPRDEFEKDYAERVKRTPRREYVQWRASAGSAEMDCSRIRVF